MLSSLRISAMWISHATYSFAEIHSEEGKPYKPLNKGFAPCLVINSSAILSKSAVVTPGFNFILSNSDVSPTILIAF